MNVLCKKGIIDMRKNDVAKHTVSQFDKLINLYKTIYTILGMFKEIMYTILLKHPDEWQAELKHDIY